MAGAELFHRLWRTRCWPVGAAPASAGGRRAPAIAG